MSTETINMRTDTARKRKLQVAADLTDRSLTSFILAAAESRADDVLAEQRTTRMPAEFFDAFFSAVADEPAEALVAAIERMDSVITRGK